MASTTQTIAPQHLSLQAEPHDVHVDIHYIKEPEDGTQITQESIHVNDPRIRDVRNQLVKDIRNTVDQFELEKNGFQYVTHQVPPDHFVDEASIETAHYPEIESLIKKSFGAKMVIIYNHIVRNETWSWRAENVKHYSGPAHRCHIDVSTVFARELVKNQLKLHNKEDMTSEVLAGKWQLLNVWRPLKTVQKTPLVVADPATVPYSDQYVFSYDRVYFKDGEEMKMRVESPYTRASKDGSHQFYYMYAQRPDEVLIFKTAESDETAVGAVPHTSFREPGTEHFPTRESLEMRLLVVY